MMICLSALVISRGSPEIEHRVVGQLLAQIARRRSISISSRLSLVLHDDASDAMMINSAMCTTVLISQAARSH